MCRVIVGIVPLDPVPAEHRHALGNFLRDHEHIAPGGGLDLRNLEGFGARGQRRERGVEKRGQIRGRDVPDDADHQIVAPEAALDEAPEVVGRDSRDALRRTLARPTVGMVGERRPEPGAARDVPRALGQLGKVRQQLAADALHRFRVETGLDKRETQQIESGQRPQVGAEVVHTGVETQADREIFETPAEGLRVELPRALVEQGGRHVGEPLLALGVERCPAAEGKAQREHRNGVILDKPRLDPRCADDALDRDLLGRDARRHEPRAEREDERKGGDKRRAMAGKTPGFHGGFHGARACDFGAGSRIPVTDCYRSKTARAASLTSASVTALTRSGQSSTSAMVRPVVSAVPITTAPRRRESRA